MSECRGWLGVAASIVLGAFLASCSPSPATPSPTAQEIEIRRVVFAQSLDARGCPAEVGDRFRPGADVHLVVEMDGPPGTQVSTDWYDPQGQAALPRLDYQIDEEFTGCVHFDLQAAEPGDVLLGTYRVDLLLNGEPVQSLQFHLEVPDEGPPGWGGRVRYRYPSGLYSLERFTGWTLTEGEDQVLFEAPDGSLLWEVAFADLREKLDPSDLEAFAGSYLSQPEIAELPEFQVVSQGPMGDFRWRTEATYADPDTGEPMHAVLYFEQWGTLLFVQRVVVPEEEWSALKDLVDELAAGFEAHEAGLQAVPEGWIPYAHTVAGFELLYPGDWQEQADDRGVTFQAPEGKVGLALQGVSTPEGEPLSPQALAAREMERLQTEHPDLRVWVSGRGQVAQLPGWYQEYEYTDGGGEKARGGLVLAPNEEGDWVYVLCFWAPAETWEEELATFRLIRQSVRVMPPDLE